MSLDVLRQKKKKKNKLARKKNSEAVLRDRVETAEGILGVARVNS